jgi:hypothetical protein
MFYCILQLNSFYWPDEYVAEFIHYRNTLLCAEICLFEVMIVVNEVLRVVHTFLNKVRDELVIVLRLCNTCEKSYFRPHVWYCPFSVGRYCFYFLCHSLATVGCCGFVFSRGQQREIDTLSAPFQFWFICAKLILWYGLIFLLRGQSKLQGAECNWEVK